MASSKAITSQRTKDRIQEIRNRVFKEASDTEKTDDDLLETEPTNDISESTPLIADEDNVLITPEDPLDEQVKTSTLNDRGTAPTEEKTEEDQNSIKKLFDIEDFEKLKADLADQTALQIEDANQKTAEKLADLEIKIPDIEKGSRVRDDLLSDIQILISKKVEDQHQNFNSTIEKLSMSAASASDLVELQDSLEKSFSERFNNDLDLALVKFSNLTSKLNSEIETFNKAKSTLQEDFKFLTKTVSNSETALNKKLEDHLGILTNSERNIEKSLLLKFQNEMKETKVKSTELETLLKDNVLNSTTAIKALKKDLDQRLTVSLNKADNSHRSIRDDLEANLDSVANANKKINAKIQNTNEEVTNLHNLIDEQRKFFSSDIKREIKKSEEKLTILNLEIEKKVSEINKVLNENNNSLETNFLKKIEQKSKEINNDFRSLETSLRSDLEKSLASQEELKKYFETRLKDNLVQTENFEKTTSEDINKLDTKFLNFDEKIEKQFTKNEDQIIALKALFEAQQKSLSEALNKETKKNEDQILSLKIDANEKIAAVDQRVKTINNALEKTFFNKIEEVTNELQHFRNNGQTQLDKITNSIKKDLSLLSSKLDKKNDFLNQELKATKDKLEINIKGISSNVEKQTANIFEKVANSKVELYKKLDAQADQVENKFAVANQKLLQNFVDVDKSIKIQADNNDKSFNLLKTEFKTVTKELKDGLNKKITSYKSEFDKFKNENNATISNFIENFEKKITALSSTLEKNQHKYHNQLEKFKSFVANDSVKSYKELKKDIEVLNSHANLSLSKLSKEFATMINECNRTLVQKVGMPDVESFLKSELDQRLDLFSNKMGNHFQTIHQNIKEVETTILKEDDLTELFKNYTLNVKIGDNKSG